MPRLSKIENWLQSSISEGDTKQYRHRVLAEDITHWEAIKPRVKKYFRTAHSDAVRRLRRLAGHSLHPFKKTNRDHDPAKNYPHKFDLTTLKGYFGEVFTYIIAESFDPCGHDDWEIPGFLFRFHVNAFQKLEAQLLGGGTAGAMVGRTGDDCLAFRRDRKSGKILAVLYCEAKCSAEHDSSLIAEAHQKLNGPGPVDVLNLIDVLMDHPSPQNDLWVKGLRTFREEMHSGRMKRFDLACYLCGQRPVRKPTWMDTSRPHENYVEAGRPLEAIEVHLDGVEAKVRAVYSEEGWE